MRPASESELFRQHSTHCPLTYQKSPSFVVQRLAARLSNPRKTARINGWTAEHVRPEEWRPTFAKEFVLTPSAYTGAGESS